MATYKLKNFSGVNISKCNPKDGDVFIDCTFATGYPHTEILKGFKNIKFIRCNLVNCDLEPSFELENCINTQISYCSHIRPMLVESGIISACADDCSHCLVNGDEDEIKVDGVSVFGVKKEYKEEVL